MSASFRSSRHALVALVSVSAKRTSIGPEFGLDPSNAVRACTTDAGAKDFDAVRSGACPDLRGSRVKTMRAPVFDWRQYMAHLANAWKKFSPLTAASFTRS
jgi:hypothetical protein